MRGHRTLWLSVLVVALAGCSDPPEPPPPAPAPPAPSSAAPPPSAIPASAIVKYKGVDDLCKAADLSGLGAIDPATAKPEKREYTGFFSLTCIVRFQQASRGQSSQALLLAQIRPDGTSQAALFQQTKASVAGAVDVPGLGSGAFFEPTGSMPRVVVQDANLILEVHYGAAGTLTPPADLKDRLAKIATELLRKL